MGQEEEDVRKTCGSCIVNVSLLLYIPVVYLVIMLFRSDPVCSFPQLSHYGLNSTYLTVSKCEDLIPYWEGTFKFWVVNRKSKFPGASRRLLNDVAVRRKQLSGVSVLIRRRCNYDCRSTSIIL